MKKKKLLKSAAKEVSVDTKAVKSSLSHGVVQTVDAATDFAASTSAAVVGFIVAIVGETLTWVIAHPLKTILLGLCIWGGVIVYDNIETQDDRIIVNWRQVKEDAVARYRQLRQKLSEYEMPEFTLPEWMTLGGTSAGTDDRQPVSQRAKPVEARQTADPIGEFIARATHTRKVYTVDRNAYQTAKRHRLAFRPGTSAANTLQNCTHVRRGGKVMFELDTNGFIVNCWPVR